MLAVDAYNLAADRRGMGRMVRQTLRVLQTQRDVEVVLVARKGGQDALRPEWSGRIVTERELRALQCDAVWYPWNGMRFAPHARAIVTIHDPFAFTLPHPNLVARLREQAPIRRALRQADLIFTVSEWTADRLRRLFGISDARLRVVANAPDPFWHPVEAQARAPYLLFLGGSDARKNAAMLFEAYDRAFGEEQSPQLVVAGTLEGEAERRFQSMRANHTRVRVDDETLRSLYAGALAVLVPSTAEGFGLPAVEAMACGAPVIASDATALPEACGGAAILLPSGDPDAWAAAMRRIVHDASLREALREKGFARVRRMDPAAPATALIASVRRFREAAR